MKKTFSEYYRPSDDEFKKLWEESIFVLDANVLLHIYRYSEEARNSLFEAMEQIGDQLWEPHHAVSEFMGNRLSVINEKADEYKKPRKQVLKLKENIGRILNEIQHPLFDKNKLLEIVNKNLDDIDKEFEKIGKHYLDPAIEDSLLNKITRILDGKVGPEYETSKLNELKEVGKSRYEKNIPPGYKDKGKKKETPPDSNNKEKEKNEYGDFIIWQQIIDKAKAGKISVIFVTDDSKEDWWKKNKGKTIGPRPELRKEFKKEVGKDVYFYNTESFLEYAEEHFKVEVSEDTLEEVKEVRDSLNLAYKNELAFLLYNNITPLREFEALIGSNVTKSAMVDDLMKDAGLTSALSNDVLAAQLALQKAAESAKELFKDPYSEKIKEIEKTMKDFAQNLMGVDIEAVKRMSETVEDAQRRITGIPKPRKKKSPDKTVSDKNEK